MPSQPAHHKNREGHRGDAWKLPNSSQRINLLSCGNEGSHVGDEVSDFIPLQSAAPGRHKGRFVHAPSTAGDRLRDALIRKCAHEMRVGKITGLGIEIERIKPITFTIFAVANGAILQKEMLSLPLFVRQQTIAGNRRCLRNGVLRGVTATCRGSGCRWFF